MVKTSPLWVVDGKSDEPLVEPFTSLDVIPFWELVDDSLVIVLLPCSDVDPAEEAVVGSFWLLVDPLCPPEDEGDGLSAVDWELPPDVEDTDEDCWLELSELVTGPVVSGTLEDS